jgi:SAM-dependent methyltransferase
VTKYTRPPTRLLEVGCGAGIATQLFARAGFDVTALDISSLFVGYAKKQDRNGRIAFLVADVSHLPLAAMSYDIVVSNAVIEHVPDVQAFIAEVARVLCPGGCVVVVSPNLLSPYLAAKRLLQGICGMSVSPLWGRNMRELLATLSHSLKWTIRKQLFQDSTFLYREPTPCYDEILADADATWWSTPHDLAIRFDRMGFRIVQMTSAATVLGKCMDRVVAGVMPSMRLVAYKM